MEQELAEEHGSVMYSIFHPYHTVTSRLRLHYFKRYASDIAGLSGEIQRFDAARVIHEQLSNLIGEQKRTFFDQQPPIEEAKEGESLEVPPPLLTSLDIMAYAYLKEELVNNRESAEVRHLVQHMPNLIRFVEFLDAYFQKAPALIHAEQGMV